MHKGVLILFAIILWSCKQDAQSLNESLVIADQKYDFDEANEILILEPSLREISGLSFDPLNQKIFAVNDEKGHFYSLNMKGDIFDDIRFSKNGDFEGIEVIDKNVYVSKNNGTIYMYNMNTEETIKIPTKLSERNDVEGLAYSEKNKSLLLACKGQALKKSKSKHRKIVYQLSLDDYKLDKKGFLEVRDKDLLEKIKEKKPTWSKSKYKRLKNRVLNFSPSGIALHPKNDDVYLLSARGSLLVIYSTSKELKEIVFLNEKSIPQPEGICFDQESTLYISTEGKGFSGKIFKFKYNN